MSDKLTERERLAELRANGWTVAVHNDYRLNGEAHTFWLLTHAESGRFVKGEGRTDDEALEQCRAATERLLAARRSLAFPFGSRYHQFDVE